MTRLWAVWASVAVATTALFGAPQSSNADVDSTLQGRVLYGTIRGLFSVTLDDGARRRLVAQRVSDAAWSPDGKHLAYATKGGLFVARSDGSSRLRLSDADIDALAWSPDGQKVFYQGTTRKYVSGVYVVSAHANAVARRVAHERYNRQLRWSPDGNLIAYAVWESHIAIASADGRVRRRLSVRPLGFVDWSPDSSQLAYVTSIADPAVYLINVDGTNRRRLASASEEGDVRWAPARDLVAFMAERDCGIGEGGDPCVSQQVKVLDPTTGAANWLDTREFADHFDFIWSPDGGHLAYTGSPGVFVTALATSETVRIADNAVRLYEWRVP